MRWANTALGLLLYWWHANKPQSGRGSIGKSALDTLPVLDVTAIGPARLCEATKLFDAMSKTPLLPLNEIDKDAARRELDERVMRKVLGLSDSVFAPLELLRMKLASEPSIRGHK